MWWRSASFLDQRHQEDPPNDIASSFKEPDTLSTLSPPQTYSSFTAAAADPFNPIPNPKISAYYQTRAAHTARLARPRPGRRWPPSPRLPGAPNPAPRFSLGFRESFCVINEFNNWRKQPDLAEAVAAIRALAAVIRASEATTMTELEIELKKASDSLKARRIIAMLSQDFIFDGCTILVHGFSRVVLEVLKTAAQNKKLIRVFCTGFVYFLLLTHYISVGLSLDGIKSKLVFFCFPYE
ncbi:hypothetical protein CFP56_037280 [Quercus suber]|uniref:Translation initiation factor eIF2B subunit alpha n=1 Tax=Quercus suber TaxID=58331 RepID=A0AAW0J5M7_QUESU